MSSNLRVNNILPSVGTNVAIGTAGGSITLTGGVTGSSIINTGVTTVAAGSVSAPSISPTGDSNTGIFFPSADTVAIAEGGVEALRVDSSGNLGIGTISVGFSQFGSNTGGVAIADIGATNTGLKISDGAYHNYLVQAGNSNLYISHYGASGDMIFGVGSSGEERAKITSTGNVEIANGNLVFSTAGKGIDFSATANSSGTMTSELLSDYEEGIWTPIASASSGTITSYTSSGRYTKVGRTVTLHFIITITNQGTASGAYLNWSGAPYVAANTFTAVGTCREQNVNGFLSTAQINGNASSGSILRYDNNGIIVNGNFCCTIVYEAA